MSNLAEIGTNVFSICPIICVEKFLQNSFAMQSSCHNQNIEYVFQIEWFALYFYMIMLLNKLFVICPLGSIVDVYVRFTILNIIDIGSKPLCGIETTVQENAVSDRAMPLESDECTQSANILAHHAARTEAHVSDRRHIRDQFGFGSIGLWYFFLL